jgi:myo-inositol-1(or 4)-monophosphatase
MNQILNIAVQAATKAGEVLLEGLGTVFQISSKDGRHNLVTEYDIRSENIIIDYISSYYPDHVFLAEESGGKPPEPGQIQWIIDPLDGTVNFAHGIPIFCVSIAAVQHGRPICGVIYCPVTKELYTAMHGFGAYLNGRRIKVSDTSALQDSILVTGFPYNVHSNPSNCIGHMVSMLRLGLPVRRLGSAALDLAYVAAGRFDGFWEINLQPWDIAAGMLLVQEAGGIITNYNGNPYDIYQGGTVLATNNKIHPEIMKQLEQAVIIQ